MTGQDPRRKKLRALLELGGFVSCMNDTKWVRLIDELRSLSMPLRYRIKLLTDSDVSEWDTAFAEEPWPYIELPALGPVLALEIEWLEIDATGPWLPGRRDWVPTTPIDYSADINKLLQSLHIPYSVEGTLFRVTGHKRRHQIT